MRPARTDSANSFTCARTRRISSITSTPFTLTEVSNGPRRAVCNAGCCSVPLIATPSNMSFRFCSTPACSATATKHCTVSSSMFCFEKSTSMVSSPTDTSTLRVSARVESWANRSFSVVCEIAAALFSAADHAGVVVISTRYRLPAGLA